VTESKYRRRFDPEYKREIVRLVEELGNHQYRLPRTSTSHPRPYAPGLGSMGRVMGMYSLVRGIFTQPMKRRIKDLEEEKAILKEAMAIFTRDGK
jgi:hypothetical protein